MTKKPDEPTNEASGQKKETPSRRRKTVGEIVPTGQGIAKQEGAGVRIQGSDIPDQSLSDRRGGDKREFTIDNTSLGEVLEHLANLEQRFYAYVHSHQERLNQRQKDSLRQEQEFTAEASLVKAKIHFLLEKTEQENSEPGANEDSSTENT